MSTIAQERIPAEQSLRHQPMPPVHPGIAANSTNSEIKQADVRLRIPPRARILSAVAELFARHGISAVSVDAIVAAAASNKMTLYRHFGSKDELVAEYLREAAKETDAVWARIESTGLPGNAAQLTAWLEEMAQGLIDGSGCRFTRAAVELREKSHPAQRVIRSYKVLQRRRLIRLCRATGLRTPAMLADALLLLFEGACAMEPSIGRVGVRTRFIHLGEAMIAARTKRHSRPSQEIKREPGLSNRR
jgi:AcrR family transcriptional regulator